MELTKSQIIFDQQAHTYTTPDGVCLQGVTGMIERQLFPDKYSGVPEFVMKRAAERGSFVHEVCELVDDLGIETLYRTTSTSRPVLTRCTGKATMNFHWVTSRQHTSSTRSM